MGIIAGLLSQNVLKYLLGFGEVSHVLGYNAFEDFFPRYPIKPNKECGDSRCVELQKYYEENEKEWRLKVKVKVEKEISK